MRNSLVPAQAGDLLPAHLFAPTPATAQRVLEFFTAQINNPNTRKAYLNAIRCFADWCEARSLRQLDAVRAFHIAEFVRELQGRRSPPTVKLHLAALRALFDWLVVGQVIGINPAHPVRGPRHVVRTGKTPVLTGDETRALLESIDTTRPGGLRDRALIGTLFYTFARVNAVTGMRVEDYVIRGRRGWVRLHEKGGREHEVPCHHRLERFLDDYIEDAGIAGDRDGPLFRSMGRRSQPARGLWQQDVYRMIQRHASASGIKSRIGAHSFRATGITVYLQNGGTLEHAQAIANHASPRTTKLYDRRSDGITIGEIEKIAI